MNRLLRSVRDDRGDVIGDRGDVIFSRPRVSIFWITLSTLSKRRLVDGDVGADVTIFSTEIASDFRGRGVVKELALFILDEAVPSSDVMRDFIAFSSKDADFCRAGSAILRRTSGSSGFASIGGSIATEVDSGVDARLGRSSSWNVTHLLRSRILLALTSSTLTSSPSDRRLIFGDLTRANFVLVAEASSWRSFADVTRRLGVSASWQTNSTISLRPM